MKKKERAILEGFAKRDNKVIKLFINQNYEMVGNYLKSKGVNDYDIEEILQQGLIAIFDISKTKKIKLKGRVVDYFFGVVNNYLKHRMREIVNKEIYNNQTEKILVDKEISIDQLLIITERFEFIDEKLEFTGKDCKKLFDLIGKGTFTEEILKEMDYTLDYYYKKSSLCKKALLMKMKKDRRFKELFDEYL